MSHVTTIDLFITDLDSLAKACDRLGLELVRGQKTFKSYQQGLKCEHLIRAKKSTDGLGYEMGLVKRADGKAGYALSWDHTMARDLVKAVTYDGKISYGRTGNADKLKDWYAAEVAQKQMRRQGFSVRAVQKQGKVQVLCSK